MSAIVGLPLMKQQCFVTSNPAADAVAILVAANSSRTVWGGRPRSHTVGRPLGGGASPLQYLKIRSRVSSMRAACCWSQSGPDGRDGASCEPDMARGSGANARCGVGLAPTHE